MQLTSKGRYAVMAMADLSAPSCATRSVPVAEIAARQGISAAYLEQLFARLRRAGLVEGVRGPRGGYKLSRPAEAVSVAQVIAAVDEKISVTRCTPGSKIGCTGKTERCATHNLWAALSLQIQHYLDGVSLRDVADGRIDLKREIAS
jgi:Rrf2 family transcriptional regulator, iron-sulfur cluster assembly transcription factor